MFKLGDRVILEQAVNAIPAGCYRYLGFDEQYFVFGVGSRIKLGLSTSANQFLRKVFPPVAFTHPNEFIEKYFLLLQELNHKPANPSGPKSFCLLDPSIPAVKRYDEQYRSGFVH